MKVFKRILATSLLAGLLGASAMAQQTPGTPGSPDATTTIDGRYIPPPPQSFQGQVYLNALQSKPGWPARVVPPAGAPNPYEAPGCQETDSP